MRHRGTRRDVGNTGAMGECWSQRLARDWGALNWVLFVAVASIGLPEQGVIAAHCSRSQAFSDSLRNQC